MMGLKKYKFKNKPFGAWLYRIALNEINQFFRSVKKEKMVPISVKEIEDITQASELESTEINLQLMVEALNELPTEAAEIIELRFFEGYSFQSIAAILGTSEANAKMRVYRTLKRLKKLIVQKSRSLR